MQWWNKPISSTFKSQTFSNCISFYHQFWQKLDLGTYLHTDNKIMVKKLVMVFSAFVCFFYQLYFLFQFVGYFILFKFAIKSNLGRIIGTWFPSYYSVYAIYFEYRYFHDFVLGRQIRKGLISWFCDVFITINSHVLKLKYSRGQYLLCNCSLEL